MDRAGADFLGCMGQIEDRLKGNPVALQLPMGSEADFIGLIDLVQMKANIYSDKKDKGEVYDVVDIPDEYIEQAKEYREYLMEAISDVDESIMERFLGGEEVSQEEVIAAVRKGTLELMFTPIFCGAAFKNKGVQQLLDAVVHYLPSPQEIPPIKAVNPKKSAPARSILLTKPIRGTAYFDACRHTVSDCGSTPPTAQNTPMAPSSTRRERSTSAVKSTWPGVSIILI